ncbi:MAG TPA: CRISPR-associated endonuclease Cas1, partial [Planctomycetota bacterium]|nr:CRISPR-associated endonuclease Cas1 [Planctomycetota bacterium]
MRTLVVSEQGAEISVQGDALVLSVGGREARRVAFAELGLVVVMGQVELTSGARRELLRRGIDAVFLSAGGR